MTQIRSGSADIRSPADYRGQEIKKTMTNRLLADLAKMQLLVMQST